MLTENTNQHNAKVVFLGSTNVGKTSIIVRHSTGDFDIRQQASISASYTSFDYGEVTLQVWDTAGAERYRSLASMFFRNAEAAVVVYSVTDRSSFDEIDIWIKDLLEKATNDVDVYLVANKIDDIQNLQIPSSEGEQKAAELRAAFLQVSASEGTGIDLLFQQIASKIQSKLDSVKVSVETDLTPKNDPDDGCC